MTTNITLDDLNQQGKQKIKKAHNADTLEELNPESYIVQVIE